MMFQKLVTLAALVLFASAAPLPQLTSEVSSLPVVGSILGGAGSSVLPTISSLPVVGSLVGTAGGLVNNGTAATSAVGNVGNNIPIVGGLIRRADDLPSLTSIVSVVPTVGGVNAANEVTSVENNDLPSAVKGIITGETSPAVPALNLPVVGNTSNILSEVSDVAKLPVSVPSVANV